MQHLHCSQRLFSSGTGLSSGADIFTKEVGFGIIGLLSTSLSVDRNQRSEEFDTSRRHTLSAPSSISSGLNSA